MKKIHLFPLILAVSVQLSCAASIDCKKASIADEKTACDSGVQNSSVASANIEPNIVKLPNKGFVKNPSAELKKQFPMCDDFLNVEWLDSANGFGYVEHDLYKNGKIIGQKKSLIYVHENQVDHLFNLERFGQLEPILEAIKKGKKIYSNLSTILVAEYKGDTVFFEHYDYTDESYADHRQNVCIPYPDAKRMWLVESRQVGKVYSQSQIDKYFSAVKKVYPTYKLEWFLKPNVSDINNDGIDDFYSTESFIFSHELSYKSIVKLGYAFDNQGEFFNFGIKETDRVCKVYQYQGGFLTTDGKNYFLNNQCNLTQLSTY